MFFAKKEKMNKLLMARMFSKYSDEHTTALPFENNNKKNLLFTFHKGFK